MSGEPLKVWAVAGSLRQDSWNKLLLQSAVDLAPDDVEVHVSPLLPEIPLFNEDLCGGNEPRIVQQLRAEVAAADAVLIVTPEYNGMIPGVLKNLIDWITFPLFNCALMDKPVSLMGATSSKLGTSRAQSGLRQVFVYNRCLVVPSPEILVTFAHQAFDASGKLTDQMVIDRIAHHFAYLKKYAQLVKLDQAVLS